MGVGEACGNDPDILAAPGVNDDEQTARRTQCRVSRIAGSSESDSSSVIVPLEARTTIICTLCTHINAAHDRLFSVATHGSKRGALISLS